MKKLPLIVAVAGILLVGGSLAYAQNAPNGNPFQEIWNAIKDLREQVRNIQLIPGPRGPQGEQGPPGPRGESLRLVDGRGQDLGILVDAGVYNDPQTYTTYLPTLDVFLPLQSEFRLRRAITLIGPRGSVFFEGQNCTGRVFHPNWQVSSIGRQMIFYAAGRYFRYNDAPAADFTANSYFVENCANVQESHRGYPLEEIAVPFTEPLTWPLRIVP